MLWAIEPHTSAKHDILRKYLDAWLPILGKFNQKTVYIDGFSGPGEYRDGEPGSPIIALEAASCHQAKLAGELVFIFIEERPDRVAHLKSRIATMRLPAQFRVHVEQGTFAERLTHILDELDAQQGQIAPTFALIDPFGFAGIPYTLIKRLLAKPRCEVLINFMVEHINRFLTHPHDEVRAHITDAFGTDEALKVAFGPGNRAEALKNLYHEQLRKSARYVRYFEMCGGDNRVVYYLFFAGNSQLGHLRMKEAMWKVDPVGEFRFSDATDPNQTLLFNAPAPAARLAEELSARFRDAGEIPVSLIETHVEDDTGYLGKHMREALQQLEREGQLIVSRLKSDGTKRRGGSFPSDAFVTFREKYSLF